MNVPCHSSFDTNFRIRVPTATGQRDLETKAPMGQPSRSQELNPHTPLMLGMADDGSGFFEVPFMPVATRFLFPYHRPAFEPQPLSTQANIPLAWGHGAANLDPLGGFGTWETDGALIRDPDHQNAIRFGGNAQGATSSVYFPAHLDPYAMPAPNLQYQHQYQVTRLNFETASPVDGQNQQGMSHDGRMQAAKPSHDG
ncbi:uncharacterized protein THITE_2107455 [Thermothielavioides terrestris NRRL 8126]|uniref:Uncharacterized protein n=1 Tax=Thermothielavioides terrestris (strain ATCC 38088 / NRRL 8126) TaxID=578455 RepID=G2QTV3_THETT|nr:uncharacterized protein THITE_2107455 [Thermothielavioides terrestris NRRL 8126]AEO62813.1 hypothetical protein THITE_2107455 [Thermothielavioides terrestris NRRL 8126]